MKPTLAAAVERLRGARRAGAARLRAHAFGLEIATLTLFVVLAATAVGRAALARTALLERETARTEALETRARGWIRDAHPTAPAETVAWRESREAVADLRARSIEPLRVAGQLARRADDVGITDLRLRLAAADTLTPPAMEAGDWMLVPGSTALGAEFTGDWNAVLAFLASVPAELQVGRVQLESDGAGQRSRVLLFPRETVAR